MDEIDIEAKLHVLSVVPAALIASNPSEMHNVAMKCAQLLPAVIRGEGKRAEGALLVSQCDAEMQRFWALVRD